MDRKYNLKFLASSWILRKYLKPKLQRIRDNDALMNEPGHISARLQTNVSKWFIVLQKISSTYKIYIFLRIPTFRMKFNLKIKSDSK